jgi:hypothetical protein
MIEKYKMKTVAEMVKKALPNPPVNESKGKLRYTLICNRGGEWVRKGIIGSSMGESCEPRVYLGVGDVDDYWYIWVDELQEWRKGNSYGNFHYTKGWFDIATMPAIAYVGLFGLMYDTEVVMSELARKIAIEQDQNSRNL